MSIANGTVNVIVSLLVMLALSWAGGIWLGDYLSSVGPRRPKPRWTIRTLMGVVVAVAVGLALVSRDRDPVVFGLAMIPPIAVFTYLFRIR
jgi:hypothetical protein